MALKNVTLKRINQATARFTAFLKYHAIGPHALTKKELKDLVMSGMVKPGSGPKAAVARSYLMTHEQLTHNFAPKAIRDGAIDFLERSFARYADKASEQFTADILGQLEAQIMPFVDKQEGKNIYELLRDRSKLKGSLGDALHGKVKNWRERYKLIVTTELARASNLGAVDAIFRNNRNKSPDDILCYKIGPNDGATCIYCKKFWFMADGVTPKVYKMSELIANGTNIGRKQKDWLATVDLTHPRGRHHLVQLQPGWGFKNGQLVYISKDYDEYKEQRR